MDWITSSAVTAIPVGLVGAPAVVLAFRGRGGDWAGAIRLLVCLLGMAAATVTQVFHEEWSIPRWVTTSAWLTGVVFFALYTLARLIDENARSARETKRKRDVSAAAAEEIRKGNAK